MDTNNTSTVDVAALKDELAKYKAMNEALVAAQAKGIKGMKVSAKGAVSIYGLGRFPVTLYRSQWEALLDKGEDIRAFIKAHAAELATKGE